MDDYLPIPLLARRFGKTDSQIRRALTAHAQRVRKTRMDPEAFSYVAKNSALINCYHVEDVRTVLLFFNGNPNNGRAKR